MKRDKPRAAWQRFEAKQHTTLTLGTLRTPRTGGARGASTSIVQITDTGRSRYEKI